MNKSKIRVFYRNHLGYSPNKPLCWSDRYIKDSSIFNKEFITIKFL